MSKKPSKAKRDTLVPPREKSEKITSIEEAKKKKAKKDKVKAEKVKKPEKEKSKPKEPIKPVAEEVPAEDMVIPEGKTSRWLERRNRRRKTRLIVLGVVFSVLFVLFLLGYFFFTIKTVQVEGNRFYEDQVISEMVLSDSNSWNALYVVFRDKFLKREKMPFIDDVEISLTGRNSIKINVFEKPMIGCIYVDGTGQYAYFDKDGLVCELSPDVMKGVPQIYGISCFDADLYDEVELSDPAVLKTLLLLVVDLDKYKIPSDSITFQGSSISLQYDHITVKLGSSQYLTEKLMRLTKVLPQLDALAGTLHLETWNPENTDIVFKKQK